jgi:hypothetical protein
MSLKAVNEKIIDRNDSIYEKSIRFESVLSLILTQILISFKLN